MSWPSATDASLLHALQHGLEALYRLEPAPQVAPFVLDRRGLGDQRMEQLYIVEGEDLELGLALDPASLNSLHDTWLEDANLPAFSLLVEGISHFLLVIHRSRQERPTSAFELELQAEVDKYVAALLLTRRSPGLPSERLRRRLYHDYQLLDGLELEEQQRYHQANALAKHYAQRLEQRFVRPSELAAMLHELRHFYRLSTWAKHAWIAGC